MSVSYETRGKMLAACREVETELNAAIRTLLDIQVEDYRLIDPPWLIAKWETVERHLSEASRISKQARQALPA